MLDRLKKYQEEYRALPIKEGRAYITKLDSDNKIRKEIAALAKYFLNRTVTNCGWCYIELHILLLKLNPDIMVEKTQEYQLRAGTLLHDPVNRDVKEILTPHSLTEERALRHLAYNSNARKFFTILPEDIDKRIASYIKGDDVEEIEKPKRGRPKSEKVEVVEEVDDIKEEDKEEIIREDNVLEDL